MKNTNKRSIGRLLKILVLSIFLISVPALAVEPVTIFAVGGVITMLVGTSPVAIYENWDSNVIKSIREKASSTWNRWVNSEQEPVVKPQTQTVQDSAADQVDTSSTDASNPDISEGEPVQQNNQTSTNTSNIEQHDKKPDTKGEESLPDGSDPLKKNPDTPMAVEQNAPGSDQKNEESGSENSGFTDGHGDSQEPVNNDPGKTKENEEEVIRTEEYSSEDSLKKKQDSETSGSDDPKKQKKTKADNEKKKASSNSVKQFLAQVLKKDSKTSLSDDTTQEEAVHKTSSEDDDLKDSSEADSRDSIDPVKQEKETPVDTLPATAESGGYESVEKKNNESSKGNKTKQEVSSSVRKFLDLVSIKSEKKPSFRDADQEEVANEVDDKRIDEKEHPQIGEEESDKKIDENDSVTKQPDTGSEDSVEPVKSDVSDNSSGNAGKPFTENKVDPKDGAQDMSLVEDAPADSTPTPDFKKAQEPVFVDFSKQPEIATAPEAGPQIDLNYSKPLEYQPEVETSAIMEDGVCEAPAIEAPVTPTIGGTELAVIEKQQPSMSMKKDGPKGRFEQVWDRLFSRQDQAPVNTGEAALIGTSTRGTGQELPEVPDGFRARYYQTKYSGGLTGEQGRDQKAIELDEKNLMENYLAYLKFEDERVGLKTQEDAPVDGVCKAPAYVYEGTTALISVPVQPLEQSQAPQLDLALAEALIKEGVERKDRKAEGMWYRQQAFKRSLKERIKNFLNDRDMLEGTTPAELKQTGFITDAAALTDEKLKEQQKIDRDSARDAAREKASQAKEGPLSAGTEKKATRFNESHVDSKGWAQDYAHASAENKQRMINDLHTSLPEDAPVPVPAQSEATEKKEARFNESHVDSKGWAQDYAHASAENKQRMINDLHTSLPEDAPVPVPVQAEATEKKAARFSESHVGSKAWAQDYARASAENKQRMINDLHTSSPEDAPVPVPVQPLEQSPAELKQTGFTTDTSALTDEKLKEQQKAARDSAHDAAREKASQAKKEQPSAGTEKKTARFSESHVDSKGWAQDYAHASAENKQRMINDLHTSQPMQDGTSPAEAKQTGFITDTSALTDEKLKEQQKAARDAAREKEAEEKWNRQQDFKKSLLGMVKKTEKALDEQKEAPSIMSEKVGEVVSKTSFKPREQYVSSAEITRIASVEHGRRNYQPASSQSTEEELVVEDELVIETEESKVPKAPQPEAPEVTLNTEGREEEAAEERGDMQDDQEQADEQSRFTSEQVQQTHELSHSAEVNLQSFRVMNLASGMMTMEVMGGFQNAMSMYRSGRMFSFGTASLDDLSSKEMFASNDEIKKAPRIDREIGSWHSFVQVHGMKAHRDNVAGMPGGSTSGQGMTAGVFYQLNSDLVTGVMLSTQKSSISYTGGLGSGSVQAVRVGPFMSWTHNDLHLDAALTLARNSYDMKRQDSSGTQLKSSASGTELAAYIGVGYDLHLDDWLQGLTLTPMAELLYSHARHGGYQEQDSDEGMNVNGSSVHQLITRIGMEIGYTLPDLENAIEIKARLGFQRQSMDGQSAGYSLNNGAADSMNLPAFSENSTFFGLGVQRKLGELSHISINYNGTQSSNGLSHGLQFNFERKF